MAPPILLNAQQALRNLEVFRSEQAAHAKSKNIQVNVPKAGSSSVVGEVICRASAINLPEKVSPPPSNVETFRNPKLHLNVVSTFLATAMKSVTYFPNESYGGTVDAAAEFEGFGNLVSNLQTFASYMPLVATLSKQFTHGPKDDCQTLLEKVKSLVAASGIDATVIITNLVVEAASLTSTVATPTVFVGYHFEGADSNPLLYIFYGIATVLRTDLGTSVATPNQQIDVSFYKYQLSSELVTRMAQSLAITVVPSKDMVEAINTRFPLPP